MQHFPEGVKIHSCVDHRGRVDTCLCGPRDAGNTHNLRNAGRLALKLIMVKGWFVSQMPNKEFYFWTREQMHNHLTSRVGHTAQNPTRRIPPSHGGLGRTATLQRGPSC